MVRCSSMRWGVLSLFLTLAFATTNVSAMCDDFHDALVHREPPEDHNLEFVTQALKETIEKANIDASNFESIKSQIESRLEAKGKSFSDIVDIRPFSGERLDVMTYPPSEPMDIYLIGGARQTVYVNYSPKGETLGG